MAYCRAGALALVLAAVISAPATDAARHLTQDLGLPSLSNGLFPALDQSGGTYDLFAQVVRKGVTDVSNRRSVNSAIRGWSEGPTNQTVLLLENDDLKKGFARVANQYNISDAAGFLDRLVDAADASQAGLSVPAAAASILISFAKSHILPSPTDLYENDDIQSATPTSPYSLETSIDAQYIGAEPTQLSAYVQRGTVFLEQPAGAADSDEGVGIPNDKAYAMGPNEELGGVGELYVYKVPVDRVFVFRGNFGPLASVISNPDSPTVDACLQYLADSSF